MALHQHHTDSTAHVPAKLHEIFSTHVGLYDPGREASYEGAVEGLTITRPIKPLGQAAPPPPPTRSTTAPAPPPPPPQQPPQCSRAFPHHPGRHGHCLFANVIANPLLFVLPCIALSVEMDARCNRPCEMQNFVYRGGKNLGAGKSCLDKFRSPPSYQIFPSILRILCAILSQKVP